MTRDERQLSFVNTFKNKKGTGTLLAATGFGKTFCAFLVLEKMFKLTPKLKVLIVVPTENLKDQWEYKIKQLKFPNCNVKIVNTACKIKDYYDFVILDEVHMYGGDIFKGVFDIPRKYILGLTATIDPHSDINKLIKQNCPVIDSISLEECKTNGWVADFEVYNLKVQFTPKEQSEYNKVEYTYRYAEKLLGGKFEAFSTANEWKESEDLEKKKVAFLYWNAMQRRKRIVINAENKIKVAVDILNKYPDKKALVFSESITLANQIKKGVGKRCAVYHSKLPQHEKVKTLKLFNESTELSVISSVQALNAGADIPACSLGIVTSGNSKEISDLQRTGRVVRKYGDKKSIFINLYIPDTQDETWLKKRQKTVIPKIISSIEEIQ